MKSVKVFYPIGGLAILGVEFNPLSTEPATLACGRAALEAFTPAALAEALRGTQTILRNPRAGQQAQVSGWDYQQHPEWAAHDFHLLATEAYSTAGIDEQDLTDPIESGFCLIQYAPARPADAGGQLLPTKAAPWRIELRYTEEARWAIPPALQDVVQVVFSGEWRLQTTWLPWARAEQVMGWAKAQGVYVRTQKADADLLEEAQYA